MGDKRQKMDSEVKEYRERKKQTAISLVEAYSEGRLEGYVEPERSGTPKGDPVGFSRKKLRAVHLMVLHPQTLKLKDIAEIAGVSEGVIRVWRTQGQFIEAIKEFGSALAQFISAIIEAVVNIREIDIIKEDSGIGYITNGTLKILKSEQKHIDAIKGGFREEISKIIMIDDKSDIMKRIKAKFDNPISLSMELGGCLPFFNSFVTEPFAKWLKSAIDSHHGGYAGLIYPSFAEYTLKEASVYDEESLRKWEKRPETIEITKAFIEADIDMLANREAWEELGDGEMKKVAERLKEEIFRTIDILSQ